jgi:hypothetical protein
LELTQQNEGPWNFEEIKKLQGDIDFLLEQEDMRWKQLAKLKWYKKWRYKYSFFPCLGKPS